MIPRGRHHFYPANRFWENRKSLFIAGPRSEFQPLLLTTDHRKPQLNSNLFGILKRCIVQKTDIQGI